MKCPECGKNNSQDFKFCQFCGHSLSQPLNSDSIEIPTSTISTPDFFDDWFVDGDNPHPSIFKNALDADEKAAPVKTSCGSVADIKNNLAKNKIKLSSKLKNSNQNDNSKSIAGCKSDNSTDELHNNSTSKPKIVDRVKITPDLKEERQLNLKNSGSPESLLSLNERDMPEPEKKYCKSCGSPLIEGHKFCGNCGQPIEIDNNYDPFCSDKTSNNINDRILMSSMNLINVPRDSMTFGQMHVMPGAAQKLSPFTFCHINDDGSEGESFQLFMGENIIGRGSSDALRNDPYVSPKHARIICHEDKAVIEDFNSLNGVFFRISNESIILYNGDIFRIGEELLLYAHGDSDQQLLSNPRGEDSDLIGNDEPNGWGYLRSILGPFSEGNVYRLWQPTVTLGRTKANIIFPLDGFVSGTHASLKVQKDYTILTDLNSSNGTFIRLKENMDVIDTAHILIGNQLIRISHK